MPGPCPDSHLRHGIQVGSRPAEESRAGYILVLLLHAALATRNGAVVGCQSECQDPVLTGICGLT